MIHCVSAWFIMIHHDLSCFIVIHYDSLCFNMIHCDLSWVIMIHCDSSWYTMSHYKSWFIVVHHDSSWFIVIHHDSSWFMVIHCDSSWFIVFQHDSSWFIMNHFDSSWFIAIYPDSLNSLWFIMIQHDLPIMTHYVSLWFTRILRSNGSYLVVLGLVTSKHPKIRKIFEVCVGKQVFIPPRRPFGSKSWTLDWKLLSTLRMPSEGVSSCCRIGTSMLGHVASGVPAGPAASAVVVFGLYGNLWNGSDAGQEDEGLDVWGEYRSWTGLSRQRSSVAAVPSGRFCCALSCFVMLVGWQVLVVSLYFQY